jgi:hypothetical protein
MKTFHYITIEGKISSFSETTYEKATARERKDGFASLSGEPDEKGVYIYSYDDYVEEVRGHIVAESEVEARKLLQKHNK